MRFLILTLGLIAFTLSDCWAMTGLELASKCRVLRQATFSGTRVTMSDTADAGICFGVFQALQDVRGVGGVMLELYPSCPPTNFTPVQHVLMFLEFIDRNPSIGHEPYIFSAHKVLARAFPCKR